MIPTVPEVLVEGILTVPDLEISFADPEALNASLPDIDSEAPAPLKRFPPSRSGRKTLRRASWEPQ